VFASRLIPVRAMADPGIRPRVVRASLWPRVAVPRPARATFAAAVRPGLPGFLPDDYRPGRPRRPGWPGDRHDDLVPWSNNQYLADLLPNNEIHPLDAGHFAWEEASQEYGRLVVDWISGGYRLVAR